MGDKRSVLNKSNDYTMDRFERSKAYWGWIFQMIVDIQIKSIQYSNIIWQWELSNLCLIVFNDYFIILIQGKWLR